MEISGIKIPVSGRLITIAALVLALIIITPLMFGINNAGERTVIQYPWGGLTVKFTPGVYWQCFGTVTVYKDLITYDFDKDDDKTASLDQKGVPVRYQDGGTGTIYGKGRYNLPNDQETMLYLHKAFRGHLSVSFKLIKPVTEESLNLTAGLMSSEEAYTEKRGIFTQWAEQQVSKGKFVTELTQAVVEESTGKRVVKNIPTIKYGQDGLPLQQSSDLREYGITVSGFQITDWDFEQKTLDQIATKREATMGIITAKANAERAKQEALTAEEVGKKNVMTAKYEKEVEKERAVVDAQREQEVAVIQAKQKVAVAEQQKLEAQQLKLAADFYKAEQILRGEGDAAYKQKVMEADGALAQKLATYEKVMTIAFTQLSQQKWVPEVMMNGNGNGANAAAGLIDIFTAKTLKDLGLNLTIPTGKTPVKQ